MSDKERISIASASKMITAATRMRVMPQKNVKLGDKACLQLPSDWTFDPKFKEVTIQQLMGHISGNWDENCGIDLITLKACAAKAPQGDKSFRYANTNDALQRLCWSACTACRPPRPKNMATHMSRSSIARPSTAPACRS
jgi:hypothetical protein